MVRTAATSNNTANYIYIWCGHHHTHNNTMHIIICGRLATPYCTTVAYKVYVYILFLVYVLDVLYYYVGDWPRHI